MDKRKRLQNFWFYNKNYVLIALAALLVLGYLGFQKANTAEPDYHIGLVRASACTEEELRALENTFTAAGADVNGDGASDYSDALVVLRRSIGLD